MIKKSVVGIFTFCLLFLFPSGNVFANGDGKDIHVSVAPVYWFADWSSEDKGTSIDGNGMYGASLSLKYDKFIISSAFYSGEYKVNGEKILNNVKVGGVIKHNVKFKIADNYVSRNDFNAFFGYQVVDKYIAVGVAYKYISIDSSSDSSSSSYGFGLGVSDTVPIFEINQDSRIFAYNSIFFFPQIRSRGAGVKEDATLTTFDIGLGYQYKGFSLTAGYKSQYFNSTSSNDDEIGGVFTSVAMSF